MFYVHSTVQCSVQEVYLQRGLISGRGVWGVWGPLADSPSGQLKSHPRANGWPSSISPHALPLSCFLYVCVCVCVTHMLVGTSSHPHLGKEGQAQQRNPMI